MLDQSDKTEAFDNIPVLCCSVGGPALDDQVHSLGSLSAELEFDERLRSLKSFATREEI